MFDFSQILELAKLEPGHGLVQSILLFMIWLQSRGLRQDVASLKDAITVQRNNNEVRFQKIEGRLTILEGGKNG
jgi:hypothetical protein